MSNLRVRDKVLGLTDKVVLTEHWRGILSTLPKEHPLRQPILDHINDLDYEIKQELHTVATLLSEKLTDTDYTE